MVWFPPKHGDELQRRWTALGGRLGVAGVPFEREGKRLIRSWARWPRRYHNTPHLLACLQHLEQIASALDDPLAAELSLWFHDAVYIPWRPLNEEKSALWAQRFMRDMELSEAMCEQVVQQILDTRHNTLPTPGDTQWIVDIDLAILGKSEAAYSQFEKDVRSEYRWVRWRTYVKGRSAVLQSFLDRPTIYATPWFRDRFEKNARSNLAVALDALSNNRLF